MKTSKHIHRLQRSNLSKSKKYFVLKCQECPAFFTEATAVGVKSTCNFCGEIFVMNSNLLCNSDGDLKKIPHCGCKNKKYKNVSKKVDINLKPKVEGKVIKKFETLDDLMEKVKAGE